MNLQIPNEYLVIQKQVTLTIRLVDKVKGKS